MRASLWNGQDHIYLVWTTCLLRHSERFPSISETVKDLSRCGRDEVHHNIGGGGDSHPDPDLKGERAMTKDNNLLSNFHLDGISHTQRVVAQIEVFGTGLMSGCVGGEVLRHVSEGCCHPLHFTYVLPCTLITVVAHQHTDHDLLECVLSLAQDLELLVPPKKNMYTAIPHHVL